MQPGATEGEPLRIVVADDHELVRFGIDALLAARPGLRIVAQAGDAAQLLAVLRATPADVLLCDFAMRGADGPAALLRIAREHPRLRIVVLSTDRQPAAVQRALANGAGGYLLKTSAAAELEPAIRSVAAGRRYLSPALQCALAAGAWELPEHRLTPRQVEILTRVALGHSARAIAEALGLSPHTVESHRARIMERLGIADIAGLTRYAMRHRLVD